jgi:hypothetical protein
MKTKNLLKNLVTVLLFFSFLLTYFFDLTGLNLHQWLSIAAAAAAVLHLLMHWNWVKAVTARFFHHCSGQARSCYILDVLLFAGLVVIFLTGLVISSWFSLAVSSYGFWRLIHLAASVISMAMLVLKLALHWKYIASVFKPVRLAKLAGSRPVVSSSQIVDPKLVSRREALRVIGTISAVGVVSIFKAASALHAVGAAALPQPALNTRANQPTNSAISNQPPSTPTASIQTATPAQITQEPAFAQASSLADENCVVRCDKGCSYPGRCRRYTDANNNQRCDLGECLAV